MLGEDILYLCLPPVCTTEGLIHRDRAHQLRLAGLVSGVWCLCITVCTLAVTYDLPYLCCTLHCTAMDWLPCLPASPCNPHDTYSNLAPVPRTQLSRRSRSSARPDLSRALCRILSTLLVCHLTTLQDRLGVGVILLYSSPSLLFRRACSFALRTTKPPLGAWPLANDAQWTGSPGSQAPTGLTIPFAAIGPIPFDRLINGLYRLPCFLLLTAPSTASSAVVPLSGAPSCLSRSPGQHAPHGSPLRHDTYPRALNVPFSLCDLVTPTVLVVFLLLASLVVGLEP
ncbi:hypothetical protein BU24DRAFT_278076 [Aaosphaeria arxii CBS 175.79]|uniref:Uncharacterized protein n=1 Tax=Aaosphaeria arxii CBS 175.79 TaxID=1450172 RepID=A0A6A5XER4_9PLEO|nr:uncharacterized protein BU24DRAFT_278076 [Aaosphaeria arxii CBS 175.79]KAF2011297.1 hypothetical protein BU24DRAFT_278076 [Aaosphaeria arxii CBS 175.79]